MHKTTEEKIKLSFQKLKDDISNLRKEISDVSEKIDLNKLNRKVNEKIYTSKPYVNQEMLNAVKEVLESGMFSLGEKNKEFEERFAKITGAKYAIAVSNGTAAIEIALQVLGIKKDDEVIVCSNTTMPTIEPILRLNAVPIFADIDEKTYTINPEEIEKKITRKTRAIIAVHLYGQSCDMDKILKIAKKHKIKVLEDCAQAHNALYKGIHVGTLGDIGCFSFYPTKNITVCGEGGMIITNDSKIDEKIRMLRSHGEKGRYNHVILGNNYRLSEIHCAIGIEQLKLINYFTEKRREIASWYNELLKNESIILPYEPAYSRHCCHLYVIRVDKNKRDRIINELKKKNIFLGIHYPIPCHEQEIVKKTVKKKFRLPITEKISKEIISLPIYPELTRQEVERVAREIKELL